jgi:DNA-binding transcriptional MerR regulator
MPTEFQVSQPSVLPPPAAARLPSPPATRPAQPAATDPADGYTTGQAVELTGLSEHTLRYYERARLLGSVRRQRSSRHRRYSADDIARLRTLACLRAAGLPLDRMRRYFELARRGTAAAPLQQALLVEQRAVLQERIRELESHLRYIDDKVAYWQAVGAGDTVRAEELLRRLAGDLLTAPSA